LLLGLAWASIWPGYLVLVAQAARLGPWPRNLGILASTVLHGLAIGVFVPGVLSWLTRRDGWAERFLGVPAPVGRQLSRAGRFLSVVAVVCLIPTYLLTSGEIAPDGRPITATAFCRFFILLFEVAAWATLVSLLRRGSALMTWCDLAPSGVPQEREPAIARAEIEAPGAPSTLAQAEAQCPASLLRWFSRRRRIVAWILLALAALIILLDVRGYRFTARRLALGGTETLVVCLICWGFNRVSNRIISQHAGRWVQPGRSWAKAITTAVTLRGTSRTRALEPASAAGEGNDAATDPGAEEDLAGRLRQLVSYAVVALGILGFAWVWELDLALLRFLANWPLWYVSETPVTVGDLARSVVLIVVGGVAWRYMSTLFALTLFPRIPDDPGVRFAIVTLCRYIVLGVTTIAALGAIRVGTAQIGMVLAALGVGLGFGLQEIVSNFVCGIILLLERPIRIGDVVTVAGTTGLVDRINIRATTIINGDNQSMIVPNREFITGNLVNWTHKDKILRVTIRVGVAYGSEPEKIVDLLLAIAADDPDVLRNPLPSALLEELGDSALKFVLYVYVPDPGHVGRVKHRLSSEVQRRFAGAQISIPYPTQEVHLCRVPDDLTRVLEQPRGLSSSGGSRFDLGAPAPPAPHLADAATPDARNQSAAEPDEGVHRAVDE
jgi:potassium efflux system protein